MQAEASREQTIRILIVDDHMLFAEALRSFLEGEGVEVVAILESGEFAVETVRRMRPDIVLLDLGLPGMGGLEVGRKILTSLPEAKVVALTALNDPSHTREALRLGFSGFLSKDTPAGEFVRLVRLVDEGRVLVSQAATPRTIPRAQDDGVAVNAGRLTEREREVLGLLVSGVSGSEMASLLHISKNTARTHVQNILTKLQVHSRLEAAAYAVRHGLIDSGGQRRYA